MEKEKERKKRNRLDSPSDSVGVVHGSKPCNAPCVVRRSDGVDHHERWAQRSGAFPFARVRCVRHSLSVSPRPPLRRASQWTLSASSAASVALSVSPRPPHACIAVCAVRASCGCRAGAVRVPCGSAALRHSFSSSLPPPPHSHHSPTHSLHPHLLFPSLPHHQHLHTTTNPPPPLPLRRAC